MPAEVVEIARCAEHGLHGERTECFVCGAEVEQVPMLPLAMTDEGQPAVYVVVTMDNRFIGVFASHEAAQREAAPPNGRGRAYVVTQEALSDVEVDG